MPDFATVVPALVQKGDDLTLRQCAVLLRVATEAAPQTVRGMAAALNISKPAITRALDRLAKEGLAARVVDPADRRSVHVQLTENGRGWVSDLQRYGRAATA